MSFLSRLARGSPALKRGYATVSDVSGVKVVGIQNGSRPGTCSVTVVANAGSRYESKPGVAHVLKTFAFKSTSHGSALKTARETELYGGILSASLSREHLFLTADFLRGDEAHFLEVLASVLSSTHFHAHEYAELVLPTVQSEALAALASPTTLALDLAHGLAFRRGLGNSLFASPHSPVSANDAKSYARQAFSKSNLAVLGTGISTDALGKAVQSAFGSGSSSSPTLSSGSSEYFGGEQRVPLDLHSGPSAQPTMVIAYGSAGAATPEMKVLPYIMGGDSSVKWNPGTSQLSLKTAEIPGATAQSFIMPYSDASLFGVIISAPTSEGLRDLAKVVVADVSSVQSGKIGKAIVKRSVAKAKFADATGLERADTMLSVAGPAIFTGGVPAPNASFAAFDKVSEDSVSKLAKHLLREKPTVVAIGDLRTLPYVDELGLGAK